jgi:hypothetical protein
LSWHGSVSQISEVSPSDLSDAFLESPVAKSVRWIRFEYWNLNFILVLQPHRNLLSPSRLRLGEIKFVHETSHS